MTESFLAPCCNAFPARTDLSPLSPTRAFITSFSPSHSHRKTLQLAILFSFTGPGVPSLAVSSRVLGARPWLFSLSSRPFGTCFIKPSAHSLADSFSVFLAPVAGCDRVSVSCSKHALQNASLALQRALDSCLRQAAPRHGPHDSTSHEPPAMAPPPRRRFLRTLGRRITQALIHNISRHATLLCWLRHQPSLAAPPEWSAACVTSLDSVLCSTMGHCTFRPRATAPPGALRGLFTTFVALAVCRSPSTTLRAHSSQQSTATCCSRRSSELTLLNTHLHVLRADCWR